MLNTGSAATAATTGIRNNRNIKLIRFLVMGTPKQILFINFGFFK